MLIENKWKNEYTYIPYVGKYVFTACSKGKSMRRTREESEETRRIILQAAEEMFIEKGYDSVSLDDVARLAGFTRGAIHWHFQNKMGLLMALHDQISMPMESLAERLSADSSLDPVEELTTTTRELFMELDRDTRRRRFLSLLIGVLWREDSEAMRERHHHFNAKLRKSVHDTLILVNERGRLSPCWTPETGAMAFHGLIAGLISEWLLGSSSFILRYGPLDTMNAFIVSLTRTE